MIDLLYYDRAGCRDAARRGQARDDATRRGEAR